MTDQRRKNCFMLTLLVGLASHVAQADAGTKVHVNQPEARGQRVAVATIDHSAWTTLLRKHVNQKGEVNYRDWQSSANDTSALDRYLQSLASANLPDPNTEAKNNQRTAEIAFWINAYNATTIKGILREYPTTSIRNHTPRLYGYHIWNDLLLTVGEKSYSLDDIEHKVLRTMGEPRIHFAIVCASVSCPRLLNDAYTADKLDDQLTTNAQEFFAKPTSFRYDASNGQFQLSSILDWFGEDFGADQSSQLKAIARFLPDATSQNAAASGLGNVSYLPYDWGLNEQQ